MAAVTICSDFGAQENKFCHYFPIYLPWSDGTRCHDLCFLNVEFNPAFSLCLFTFIKKLFNSTSFLPLGWYHLHIWGYWYFSWQSWFQLMLHPAWHFTWCTLHISSNKQGDNILPWFTPFPILSQSIVPCLVLLLLDCVQVSRRQVRWSSIPISLRIFHSLLWSTQSKVLA